MLNNSYRIIFHIDLNCFFAACEVLENPALKGKPIVVCHKDPLRHSIILTASYEARRYGIYTTMLLNDAIILCPGLTAVEPHYDYYKKYSDKFFAYLRSITPKVEPMSIDEGFLDMSEVVGANAEAYAKKMQDYILNVIGLPCSIGIGPNKFLAKMASDMKKPLGITILRKRDIPSKMWPLPVKDMLGVGKKTQARLVPLNIKTIGDLVNYPNKELLKQTIGVAMFEYVNERGNGIDNSSVEYENLDEVSSISNETTFPISMTNIRYIKDNLKVLTNQVSHRLVKRHLAAQTVGIKIKFSDFTTISRSRSVKVAINDNMDMWDVISDLFDDVYDGFSELRLVGVFANRFIDQINSIRQYSLFDDFEELEKDKKVNSLVKMLKKEYGDEAIGIGARKTNGKRQIRSDD